jgi:hypothetical protein
MCTKNQGLARDPEGEIGRTGTRVSLFLPLSVILSSLHDWPETYRGVCWVGWEELLLPPLTACLCSG